MPVTVRIASSASVNRSWATVSTLSPSTVTEQDDELVAADSHEHVAAAQALSPLGDEKPEDVVSDFMAEGVVQVLEVVDVE